jgi:hypothetical protein
MTPTAIAARLSPVRSNSSLMREQEHPVVHREPVCEAEHQHRERIGLPVAGRSDEAATHVHRAVVIRRIIGDTQGEATTSGRIGIITRSEVDPRGVS